MRQHIRKRKCKNCKAFFDPDPRNVGRQHFCSRPLCRKVSKADSQRRWLHKPENCDHFRGPVHVERVRQWRKAHPGYWRATALQVSPTPEALQDASTPQGVAQQQGEAPVNPHALQDSFFLQPTVFVGLLAHLTGLS